MDALQREYDRFGPWALELSEDDPPPRLFEPYLMRGEAPILGLKIPRHVERRNVRPGADLYDRVVALYEDELIVLERVGDGVASRSCRVSDIQHLRMLRSLLSGNVHIALPTGSIDLPYNTVSDALMRRFVGLIRARYLTEPGVLPVVPAPAIATDGLSFYFQHYLEAEARDGSPMRLLAVQTTTPAAASAHGRLRRMFFSIADKRLLESVHACDGCELRILSRGQAYAYRWEAVYALETTWIPLVNIRSVAQRPDTTSATTTVAVATAGGECTFVFDAANPTLASHASFLESLSGLRPATSTGSRLVA
jgi:hypothetical protein